MRANGSTGVRDGHGTGPTGLRDGHGTASTDARMAMARLARKPTRRAATLAGCADAMARRPSEGGWTAMVIGFHGCATAMARLPRMRDGHGNGPRRMPLAMARLHRMRWRHAMLPRMTRAARPNGCATAMARLPRDARQPWHGFHGMRDGHGTASTGCATAMARLPRDARRPWHGFHGISHNGTRERLTRMRELTRSYDHRGLGRSGGGGGGDIWTTLAYQWLRHCGICACDALRV
ncbi:hypothetical protein CYMTET_36426 [Cymbomonas tetramitiformis]|uniref:Uncharacterized protein n=1 Tax=Cymbomonas tetramitiformis TaxID=36881 RepID=A0AAE0CFZ1_9CHLO|nr:hypothetical protein CYMTET_36426 [Cymbomonas tetramitiformis]